MTDIKSSVELHSNRMGSSTAERRINCPASYKLELQAPEQPPNQAALDGSAQHAVIEHLLLTGETDPTPFVGLPVAEIKEFTDDMATNVKIAHKSAEELLAGYPDFQLIEQRIVHNEFPDVFGTADVFAVQPSARKALCADHKFGYVEVEADNYQALFLMANALYDERPIWEDDPNSPSLAELLAEVEVFTAGVIQPSFDPAHTTKDYARDEIVQFRKRIDLALTMQSSPDAMPVKGSWCGYCRARLTCPAQTKAADDLFKAAKHAPEFSPANLAKLWTLFKEADELREAVTERIEHELNNGTKVPGLEMNNGRAMDRWLNPSPLGVVAELRGLGMIDADIVKPISPAQARKLAPPGTEKDLAAMIKTGRTKGWIVKAGTATSPALPSAAFARAAAVASANAGVKTKKR